MKCIVIVYEEQIITHVEGGFIMFSFSKKLLAGVVKPRGRVWWSVYKLTHFNHNFTMGTVPIVKLRGRVWCPVVV